MGFNIAVVFVGVVVGCCGCGVVTCVVLRCYSVWNIVFGFGCGWWGFGVEVLLVLSGCASFLVGGMVCVQGVCHCLLFWVVYEVVLGGFGGFSHWWLMLC